MELPLGAWNSKAIDYWNGDSSEELQWHAADSLETPGWLQLRVEVGRWEEPLSPVFAIEWTYIHINRRDSWNEIEHES